MHAIHSIPNCAVSPSDGAKPRTAAELSAVPMTPELRQQITEQCEALSKVAMNLPSGPEKLRQLTELKSLLELLVPTPGSPVQSSPPANPQTQTAAPTTSAPQSLEAAIRILHGSGPILDRIVACGTLAHIGTEDALRALCNTVVANISGESLRAAAVEALKRNARHPTVEQLLVSSVVTKGAGFYYGLSHELSAAPSLLRGLSNKAAINLLVDAVISDRNFPAADSLVGLKESTAIQTLAKNLVTEAKNIKISRRGAEEKDFQKLLPLVRALTGVSEISAQKALFSALLSISAGAFSRGSLSMRTKLLHSIGVALRGLTDPRLIRVLVTKGLSHNDEDVAIATCEALRDAKHPKATHGLKELVVSNVGIKVRTAAAAALGEQDAVALAIKLANEGFPPAEIATNKSITAWLKGWLGF